MKKLNGFFLLLAFLGTLCLIGIGIFIAEESVMGILISILLLVCIIGFGFMRKKKTRENGSY